MYEFGYDFKQIEKMSLRQINFLACGLEHYLRLKEKEMRRASRGKRR